MTYMEHEQKTQDVALYKSAHCFKPTLVCSGGAGKSLSLFYLWGEREQQSSILSNITSYGNSYSFLYWLSQLQF